MRSRTEPQSISYTTQSYLTDYCIHTTKRPAYYVLSLPPCPPKTTHADRTRNWLKHTGASRRAHTQTQPTHVPAASSCCPPATRTTSQSTFSQRHWSPPRLRNTRNQSSIRIKSVQPEAPPRHAPRDAEITPQPHRLRFPPAPTPRTPSPRPTRKTVGRQSPASLDATAP